MDQFQTLVTNFLSLHRCLFITFIVLFESKHIPIFSSEACVRFIDTSNAHAFTA